MLAAFDIHELIAQTPEGVVYEGEEKQGGAPIVMRRYLVRRDGERGAQDTAAFHAEVAKAQGVEEAHVVGILEAGFDPQDHHPYFVSRMVLGETLPKMLNGSLLAESDALGVVKQALEGLEFLHGRGLVHGGLRPDRLVWSRTEGVWLMEAGVEPALIKLGDYAAAGEPATTAPELRGGGARSVAGDFHALGACMFELLSGAPIPTDGRPRPSVGNGSLARWDRWLDAMCAADPAARPASIAQAHDLLTAALAIIPMRKHAPAKPAPVIRTAGSVRAPQKILAPGQTTGSDPVAPPAAAPSAGRPKQLATPAASMVQIAPPSGLAKQLVTPAHGRIPSLAAPVATRQRFMTPRRAAIAAILGLGVATGIFFVLRSPADSQANPPAGPTAAVSVKTPDRPAATQVAAPPKPSVPFPSPTASPGGQGNAPRYTVKRTPDMRRSRHPPRRRAGEPGWHRQGHHPQPLREIHRHHLQRRPRPWIPQN
jgi:serine/threonine protein kinase